MMKKNIKPKSFGDFTLKQAIEQFDLDLTYAFIFENMQNFVVEDWLHKLLALSPIKFLNTEKARSEAIIYPIIAYMKSYKKFALYSGENVNVSEEEGLKGEFDFALGKNLNLPFLASPIFTLVEAKLDNIEKHFGQIVAQMVAAQRINEAEKNDIQVVFGCITTGKEWRFLSLEAQSLIIHEEEYFLKSDLEKIMGAFQWILDFHKLEK